MTAERATTTRPRGRPTSSPEEVERRRRRIVEAAYEEFAERGYHGTGVADIARRMGTGHGTIYHYFSGKPEILDAVIDYVIERFAVAAVGETLDPPTTFEELVTALENAALRVWEEADRNPGLFRMLLFELPTLGEEQRHRLLGMDALINAMLAAVLSHAVDRGLLRADLDTAALGRAINGIVNAGYLGLLEGGFESAARQRYIKAVSAVLADGIRP